MAHISKIVQQKKNRARYNIYLVDGDKEAYAFAVDEDLLVQLQLSKGKEITDLDKVEIIYRDNVQKAFQSAIVYLSYRMRSEKEIQTYLKENEWDQQIIEDVLHKLRKYSYVNDAEFAVAFVRTQANVGKKGPVLIGMELSEKGIEGQVQEEALSHYSVESQWVNAKIIAEKALQKSKGSAYEIKQKALHTLIRKGYTQNMASVVIKEIYEFNFQNEWTDLCQQGYKLHKKYSNLDYFEYCQKIKGALFRKGYPSELINKFINLGKENIDQQFFGD